MRNLPTSIDSGAHEMILRPDATLTPHERRLRELGRLLPVGLDAIQRAALERDAKFDIRSREFLGRVTEILPLLHFCRVHGASGLRMSRVLRYFFQEYLNRMRLGPDLMPLSFNVVEAFFRFRPEYMIFDLRYEKEHLLGVSDFFDWYSSAATGKLVLDPGLLKDVMLDDVIYSYDLIGMPSEFWLSTPDSKLAILGVSMIRHKDELSLILSAGENPPCGGEFKLGAPTPGKEAVTPDPLLSSEDRLVPGLPEYSHVMCLTRVYLDTRRYDVRYVLRDTGKSFVVLTDDRVGFSGARASSNLFETVKRQLPRYDDLFSALASLIYLPACFVARQKDLVTTQFATELNRKKQTKRARSAAKVLGSDALVFQRSVECLTSEPLESQSVAENFEPPMLQSAAGGYWRELGPFEFGEDPEGHPVVGKTWVETTETWCTHDPASFLIHSRKPSQGGVAPGIVYVMRSPAHEIDLYKIGLTTRDAVNRAQELGGSTAVPLPFGVLATWPVRDCKTIEKRIHQTLAPYRVSKRREFFRVSLAKIISAVDGIIRQYDAEQN